MSIKVEKDWGTIEGYRACVLLLDDTHRCGYVGIPKDHKLFGVGYSCSVNKLKDYLPENERPEKRGIMAILGANNTASLGVVFNVHGSLTYSGSGEDGYPVGKNNLWWFGYDCNHYQDNLVVCNLTYCGVECNCLSRQLKKVNDYLIEQIRSLKK